jgi:hypothetical protein
VEIYEIDGETGSFVDPRRDAEEKREAYSLHHPLKDIGLYMLEASTTSTLQTIPILPVGKAFVARLQLAADFKRHPTGGDWQYYWERWQVFRTDIPNSKSEYSE